MNCTCRKGKGIHWCWLKNYSKGCLTRDHDYLRFIYDKRSAFPRLSNFVSLLCELCRPWNKGTFKTFFMSLRQRKIGSVPRKVLEKVVCRSNKGKIVMLLKPCKQLITHYRQISKTRNKIFYTLTTFQVGAVVRSCSLNFLT